jgi:hypothetical protein
LDNANGLLFPNNNTLDLLIGGRSTASAKFAFINVANTTPTASIAGNLSLAVPSAAGANTFNLFNNSSLNFQRSPGGNAGLTSMMYLGNNGYVGIGTTAPASLFSIGGTNQFQVNSSGALTAATGLTSSGTITLSALVNDKGILYMNGTGGVMAQTAQGAANTVLHGNGSTAPSFSKVDLVNDITGILQTANGGSWFNSSSGALYPGNTTLDFLIGGAATTSANFRIAGSTLSGTQPAASASANSSFAALVVDNRGIGDLFTASKSGATKFVIQNNGNLQFAGTSNFLTTLASAATAAQTITFPNASGTICLSSANCSFDSLWTTNAGALYPGNTTTDLLIGGVSTASASFRISGSTLSGTQPAASASANSSFAALVVDNRGTGDLFTASKSGATKFVIANTGFVGIGTAMPNSPLEILNTTNPQLRLSYSSAVYSTIGTDINGNLNLTTPNGANTGIDIVSGINSGNGTNEALAFKTNQTIGNTDELLQILNNASPLLTILGNGNVGIGTTNPLVALDITGVASISANISMDGAYLASHTFNILNNGTLNFQRSPGGDADLATNSVLYLGNNGNVGIGTTNPLAALDVTGAASISANISMDGAYLASHTFNILNNGTLNFQRSPSGDAGLAANSVLYLGNNGNVGIGTTNPSSIFSVGSNSQFQVNSSGAVAAATGIISSGTITFSSGVFTGNNAVLYGTAGSGVLAAATTGISSLCLISTGTNVPGWGSCITGANGNNWWNLNSPTGTLFPINSTLDFILGGASTTSAKFAVLNMAGGTPVASIAGNFSVSGANLAHTYNILDNGTLNFQTSAAGDAGTAGNSILYLGNNGNIGIGTTAPGVKLDVQGSVQIGNNSGGDDIFKHTTSDFTQAINGGYSVTTADGVNNVSTSGNQLSLITDLIGAGASTASAVAGPVTGQAINAGAFTFQRPDRKFMIVNGAGTRFYDPNNPAVIGGGIGFTVGTLGAGATGFQRADGSFMVIKGGGNTTQIYFSGTTTNEQGSFAVGPVTSANVGAGSLVIRRSDGKFLLIHGNASGSTSIYDSTLNIFAVGPAIAAGGTVTTGSFQFAIPNGKWIVALGGAPGTTNIYDPMLTGPGGGGSFTAGPPLSGNPGAGAHVIQLPDGRMLVILGGGNATSIYNPATNTFAAGPNMSQNAGAGAHSFQQSDGKWVVILGGGGTNVQIYDPSSGPDGTFAPAAALNGAGAGAGAHTFQRPDGMYIIIHGNNQSTTTLYDGGWNTSGTWTSENINSNKISTYSAMFRSDNPQSANNNARLDLPTIVYSVKTADIQSNLSSASWVTLNDSGDLIKAVASAAWVKIKVDFYSPIRSYPSSVASTIVQRNIWEGEGGAFYRRSFIIPSVFSLKIQNPLVSYGDLTGQGDPVFGRNFATAGATLEGVGTDNSNRLSLLVNRNLPTSTASAGIIIASASANLGANAQAGTHTIERSNGQFLIIIGGSTSTRIYDPLTNTFSAGPNLPYTAGPGAHSFLMPNGKFFTVLGNTTNYTAIFDPQTNSFSAGPSLFGNVGTGANTAQLPSGMFLIINGGITAATNILDPITMAVTVGPATTVVVAGGGFNIKRPDGRILVLHGNGVATTSIYDPILNAFAIGPALLTNTLNTGSTAIQMSNGKFLIKASTLLTTAVYDPNASINTSPGSPFVVGPAMAAGGNVAAGDMFIPRSDGKIIFLTGAVTSVVDASNIAIASTIVGPTLPCTLAAGSNVFQRSTGEYVVICGGNTANTFIVDAGWNLGGTYTSEQLFEPNLSANTSMFWKNDDGGSITVKYKTSSTQKGLGLTAWRDLPASGTKINYNPGDSWFQTRIDLQGTLQDLPGAKTRVWLSESSGGAVVYYRQVDAPVLQYWKLSTDSTPTMLTLQDNGQNVFRFTADGQAFTSDNGSWNSGGADLAERYTSTESLQDGEVVVSDMLKSQNVIRSTDSYQSNIMGVVSTQPGFVAGAYTENSYPIALVGRVPVKISTENGAIHSGDYLTSSSIPGYAMKATMAGRVLGTALEDFDPMRAQDCPKYGQGNLPATQCGAITVFVNLTSYNGENVESLMADSGFTGGLSEDNGLSTSGYASAMTDRQQQTLAFLKSIRDSGRTNGSEVFTDKVNAATQIISPTIITDLLIAKTIKADQIEGLQILTNRISALENWTPKQSTASAIEALSQEVLAESTPSAGLNNGTLNIADINVDGIATVSGNLRVKGNTLIEGILNVVDTVMSQNMIINQLATFFGDVVFKGNISFEGQPTFNKDVAGLAVIDKDNDFVEVKFDNEYKNIPIVTATISLDKNVDDSAQKALEEDILNGNFQYVITRKTTKGFIIRLNKKATSNITFSWVAISVKDPVTTESKTNFQDYLNSQDKAIATPSATPTPEQ